MVSEVRSEKREVLPPPRQAVNERTSTDEQGVVFVAAVMVRASPGRKAVMAARTAATTAAPCRTGSTTACWTRPSVSSTRVEVDREQVIDPLDLRHAPESSRARRRRQCDWPSR